MLRALAGIFILLASSMILTESAITPGDLIQFGRARQQCQRNNNVNPEVFERVLSGELVNDRQFDCFVACVLQKLNLLMPDGNVNADLIINKVPENIESREEIINGIRRCSQRRGTTACDTGHELFVCIHQNNIPSILLG